jgi:hypothetical protein
MTRDQGGQMIRFMQGNRPGVGDIDDPKAMDKMRERFLRLAQLVTDPKAPLCEQLRARLAFTALNTSGYVLRDLAVTDEDCHKAALSVALELITGCPKPTYEARMKS